MWTLNELHVLYSLQASEYDIRILVLETKIKETLVSKEEKNRYLGPRAQMIVHIVICAV